MNHNQGMKTVLFLCSANYYRSRFAEHFFNWHAENSGLRWKAISKGPGWREAQKYDYDESER